MTDKEKLVALLTEFGVSFKDERYGSGDSNIIVKYNWYSEQHQSKVTGYNGFFTQFTFNTEEKFIEMGAWE